MTEPLLTNDRAKREWAWIVGKVGEPAAKAAIEALGSQRAYPLNIARKLKLTLPASLATAPPASRETAMKHLAEARAVLSRPKPTTGT